MTRCYLVRHAQTLWNEESRIQGHSDLPLSPLGQEQARRVGVFFAARHVRGIVTSHLQRSRQTAAAIAAGNGHGVTPLVEPGLAEMSLGAWEGLTPAEVNVQFAGAYQQWRQRPSSVAIPQAEPLEQFQARVRATFARVTAAFGDGEYVVVSHGGVIAAILAEVLGADYDALLRRVRLDNAGVTALEFWSGAPHIVWVNAAAHLEPLPASAGWF